VADGITAIPAKDRNGNQLVIYEIWGPRRLFGLLAHHRLELETGELVEELDEDNFVVIATGERLTRTQSQNAD
jgi:hypothetical protein